MTSSRPTVSSIATRLLEITSDARRNILVTSFILTGLAWAPFAHAQPNLTPYAPADWSEPIVVSNVKGATDVTAVDTVPLHTTDSLYVSWTMANLGTSDITTLFQVDEYVDGALWDTWTTQGSLAANTYTSGLNDPIGTLAAGTHTIKIVIDSTHAIAETNESDNTYTKTITVFGVDQPNLLPYLPPGWSDSIVVATSPSSTDNNAVDAALLSPPDTLYVSVAMWNEGTATTRIGYKDQLIVDGVLKATWTFAALNSHTWDDGLNQSIGSLAPGTHTIRLVLDSTNAIAESNEADNTYTKSITIRHTPGGRAGATIEPVQGRSPISVGGHQEPFSVSSFIPTEGTSASLVTIWGSGFTTHTSVTFGQRAATVAAVSPNRLAVIVPLQNTSPVAAMSSGPVTLAVDGATFGTFLIREIPQNPNPPGTLVRAAVSGLTAAVAPVESALQAQLPQLLARTTDPSLHALLDSALQALPAANQAIDAFGNMAMSLPEDQLALVERLLLASRPSASESALSAAADVNPCANIANDPFLCDRSTDIHLAGRIFTPLRLACNVLSILQPYAVLPCAAFAFLTEMYEYEKIYSIYHTAITGETALQSGDSGQYNVVLTVGPRGSPSIAFPLIDILAHISHLNAFGITASNVTFLINWLELSLGITGNRLPPLPGTSVQTLNIGSTSEAFAWQATGPLVLREPPPGHASAGTVAEPSAGVVMASLVESLRTEDEIDEPTSCNESTVTGCLTVTVHPEMPSTSVTLTIAIGGTGTGTVTSPTGGVDCRTICSALFSRDQKVMLTATPDPGSSFGGWGAPCSGTGSCVVTMNSDLNVSAMFAANAPELTVSISGLSSVQTGQGNTWTAVAAGGSPPYGYSWTCSDGQFGLGPVFTNTFASEGTYTLSYLASDTSANGKATATKDITVTGSGGGGGTLFDGSYVGTTSGTQVCPDGSITPTSSGLDFTVLNGQILLFGNELSGTVSSDGSATFTDTGIDSVVVFTGTFAATGTSKGSYSGHISGGCSASGTWSAFRE